MEFSKRASRRSVSPAINHQPPYEPWRAPALSRTHNPQPSITSSSPNAGGGRHPYLDHRNAHISTRKAQEMTAPSAVAPTGVDRSHLRYEQLHTLRGLLDD